MGLKLKGLQSTVSTFREVDRRCTDAAKQAVKEGAQEMSALARSYAPFKKGDLEMGIRARRDQNSSSFTYKIGVQGRAAKYAWQLHEGFIWNQKHAGAYRLGRLSLAKALLNGKKVGPKYLERAYRELKPRIAQRVKEGLQDTITQISNKRRK